MNKFVKVRNDLLNNEKLNDNAKYLYMMVLSHMNRTGKCYFKRETISEETGLALRTITNLFKKLETEGFLKIYTQYYNYKKTNNAYELTKNNSGYTYVNYDILFNDKLSNSDIVCYARIKRIINNDTKKFIGTKVTLIEKTNIDKKKMFATLKNLENAGIISTVQEEKFVLELTYDIDKKMKNEFSVEYIKWEDCLNDKNNIIGEYETFEDWCDESRKIC